MALRLKSRNGAPPSLGRDCPVVQGELGWVLEGDPSELAKAVEALGTLAAPVGERAALLDFGNAVGFLDISGIGNVEVVSGKWSRADHEWMLQDLMQVASALPFTTGTPTGFPYDRSVVYHPDIRYHAFVYLRHVLSDAAPREERLLPSLQLIVHEPHRRVTRALQSVPIESARRVDAGSP